MIPVAMYVCYGLVYMIPVAMHVIWFSLYDPCSRPRYGLVYMTPVAVHVMV